MANYPKELTDLLQQYMTDGNITEKERAVLLRKAESMGVDKDEFDLYIDAEEQKFDQKIDTAKRQAKGKLCPFCDASVPMFTDKCPECGGNITPEATKELEEIINKLEDALVNFKDSQNIARSKAEVERYVRKALMYYSNNRKVQLLVEEVKEEIRLAEKRHNSVARGEKVNKALANTEEKVKKALANTKVLVAIEVLISIILCLLFDDEETTIAISIIAFFFVTLTIGSAGIKWLLDKFRI